MLLCETLFAEVVITRCMTERSRGKIIYTTVHGRKRWIVYELVGSWPEYKFVSTISVYSTRDFARSCKILEETGTFENGRCPSEATNEFKDSRHFVKQLL